MFRCFVLDVRLQLREQPLAETSIPVLPDILARDTFEVFENDDGVLEPGRVFDGFRRGFLDFVVDGGLILASHKFVEERRRVAALQAVFCGGLFLAEVSDTTPIDE